MISLDSDEYSMKEDIGSFMAAVTATRAADFPYTVNINVLSTNGTALGKQDKCSMCLIS